MDVFGKPGEGVHAWRLFSLAGVDVIGTLLICWWVSRTWQIPFWKVFIAAAVLAVVMHRLFRVDTRINVALFGRLNGSGKA
jgi:hypothetical protein